MGTPSDACPHQSTLVRWQGTPLRKGALPSWPHHAKASVCRAKKRLAAVTGGLLLGHCRPGRTRRHIRCWPIGKKSEWLQQVWLLGWCGTSLGDASNTQAHTTNASLSNKIGSNLESASIPVLYGFMQPGGGL